MPAIGLTVFAQLIFNNISIWSRIRAGLFGFAGGCCCYLAAFYWASGSPHTSLLEIVIVTPLAIVLPIFFIANILKKWRKSTADKNAKPKTSFWQNHLNNHKKFPLTLLIIFLVGFAVLTIRNVSILNMMTAQKIPLTSKSATLSFYDRFGYWPAAFLTPCVGLIFIGYCAWMNCRKS